MSATRVEGDRGLEPVRELERDDVAGADPAASSPPASARARVRDRADRGLRGPGVGPDPDRRDPGARRTPRRRAGRACRRSTSPRRDSGSRAPAAVRAERPVGGHGAHTTSRDPRVDTRVRERRYQRRSRRWHVEREAVLRRRRPRATPPPRCRTTLTRTDLVMYAGASGDFNPMHTDEVSGAGGRAAERVRPRHVHRGAPRDGGHRLRRRRQPAALQGALHQADLAGRDAHHHGSSSQKKYDEHGEHRVDLECTVVNQDGEAKLTGVAVAALPARA